MLDGFLYVTLFLLGLAFGSFANVVIWRFPRGESLSHPGSHCPACDHLIRWYDNVPVFSWLVLRGRCRDCGGPISMRYPAIELLTALLWLASGVRWGFSASTLIALIFCYLLLILSAIDLDTMRLPNALVGLLATVGFLAVLASQFTVVEVAPLTPVGGPLASPLVAAIVGSLSAGGLSLAIAATYSSVRGRAGFGMGDVKLLFALGPFLGVYTFGVLFLGSVLGAVAGVAAARKSDQGMAAKIPFGPSLAAAAVILAFFGPQMWDWYAGMVGLV